MNYGANFQDLHLQNAFDSKACCSLNGRHCKTQEMEISERNSDKMKRYYIIESKPKKLHLIPSLILVSQIKTEFWFKFVQLGYLLGQLHPHMI
jgi:hypothetical protein